ncbi:MAG: FliH/SctL family protein [Pirellulaceae bacterium]
MSVIKAGRLEAEGHAVSSVTFNLDDVSHRAQDELNQVKLKAAEIVKQAHEEAEAIKRNAETQGRQAAEAKARQMLKLEVDQQVSVLLPAIGQLVSELTLAKQTWLAKWESIGVEVATAIAEKVIRREVATRPEITAGLLKETLQLAAGCNEIRVHMNPQDLETMQNGDTMMASEIKKLAPVQIVPDPNVSRGGCLLESEFGRIDQRIESQLARINEELS